MIELMEGTQCDRSISHEVTCKFAFIRGSTACLAFVAAALALIFSFLDVSSFWRHATVAPNSTSSPIFPNEPQPLPPSSIWCQESADNRRRCRYRNICYNLRENRLFLRLTDRSIYGSSIANDGKSKWDLDDGLGFRVDTWPSNEGPVGRTTPLSAFLLQRDTTLTAGTFDDYLQFVLLPGYFSIKWELAVALPAISDYVIAVIDGQGLSEIERAVLEAALGGTVLDVSSVDSLGSENVCFSDARPAISSTFAFPGFTFRSYEGVGVGVAGATYLSRDELREFGRMMFKRLCENDPEVCNNHPCLVEAPHARTTVSFVGSELKVGNVMQPDISDINFIELLCLLRSSSVVVGPENLTLAAEIFQREKSGFILAESSLESPSTEMEPFWLGGRLKASWNLTHPDFCDGNFLNKLVPDLKLNEFAQLLEVGAFVDGGLFGEEALSEGGSYLLPTRVSEFSHSFDVGNSSLTIFWQEPWNVEYLGGRSAGYEVVLVPQDELQANTRNFVYTEKNSLAFGEVDVKRVHILFIYCVLDKNVKGGVRRSPQWFYVVPPYKMN